MAINTGIINRYRNTWKRSFSGMSGMCLSIYGVCTAGTFAIFMLYTEKYGETMTVSRRTLAPITSLSPFSYMLSIDTIFIVFALSTLILFMQCSISFTLDISSSVQSFD